MSNNIKPIDPIENNVRNNKKQRCVLPQTPNDELVRIFWLAPLEAYFSQNTIAPVAGCLPKTLESDRWKGIGIPYRKVNGRVLYQKQDVVSWLENHPLVTSTSQYQTKED